MRESLTALEKAVQGLIVMSADLEDIFSCLRDGRVPASWLKGAHLLPKTAFFKHKLRLF